MGTTADLARVRDDGTIQFTHVSGDGYLSGMGAQLLIDYQTPEALDVLFAGPYIEWMGDPDTISHLEPDEYGGDEPGYNVADWFELGDCWYVYIDGQWKHRVSNEAEDAWWLEPLTREAIMSCYLVEGKPGQRLTDYLDGKIDWEGNPR